MRLSLLGGENLKFLLDEILKPLSRRIGTSTGVFLTTLGANSELSTQVEVVLPTLLGLLFDLGWSHLNRIKDRREMFR
tara:strand:- start:1450 stop:1683 length:234 start_codon:yes stop_codon:yes gene_type:complete